MYIYIHTILLIEQVCQDSFFFIQSGVSGVLVLFAYFLPFFLAPLIFPGCHSIDMSQIIHVETGMSESVEALALGNISDWF